MTIIHRFTAIASLLSVVTGCAATEPEGTDAAINSTTDDSAGSADVASTEQAVNGNFIGCRGTALDVCDEHVDPDYFRNHPGCRANLGCNGLYWACDVNCPTPTAKERPNVMVKAAGTSTPTASMMIGYTYTYTVPPGYTSGSFHSNSLSGNAVQPAFAWKELGLGIGVNGESTSVAQLNCDTGSAYATRKITSISVRWNNGATRSIPCGDSYCSATGLTIGTGFVATCNFAAR